MATIPGTAANNSPDGSSADQEDDRNTNPISHRCLKVRLFPKSQAAALCKYSFMKY
jgi:hypothetical protein